MKTSRLTALGLLIALIVSLFYTVPSQYAQPVAPLTQEALWIATIDKLVKLDPTDGSIDAETADATNLLRLAIDEADGTLWAYSQGTLSAFDASGGLLLSTPVPPPASSTKNLALAVNSNDGSVWLALQKNLHHFDDQGELVDTIVLSAQTVDLSFDTTTDHLWVATQSSVTAFDNTGSAITTLALPKKAKVVSIAVDKANGNLWVALNTALQLYDSNGALLAQAGIKKLDKLSDDGNHGIWAVSGSSLLRISASLQRLLSVTPLPKKAKVSALIGDPTDQSVWVGGSKSLVHLNSNGTNLLSIPLSSNLSDLALLRSAVSENRQPVANNDSALTAQNNAITITVLGNDSDPDGDSLTIQSITQGANGSVKNNNTTVTYTPNNNFHGTDSFTYTISDGQGHSATATVNVTVNQAPQVNAGQDQTITLPANASLNGSVADDGLPTPVNISQNWSKVSGPGTVSFGNANATSTSASFSQAGTYVLRLTASDGFLQSSDDVQITVNPAGGGGGGLPPDPSTVAPPNNPSSTTTIAASTQFLYTGPNPIQTGVVNGTIDPLRAAVLRGKVIDRNGAPISGVTVKILNRPEFGQTVSRSDGIFDLAVNGGSSFTVDYQKAGLLPAQRQVSVPWQDFVVIPDVVLITLDAQVTPIGLNSANTQIARGSISSDVDGNRRATLVFRPGTTANMIMPNGSSQPLANMQVRATEYTIGENGPKSMPAPLPPTSGYTYAVELSADEAIAAGAKKVVFNQPVIKYLENFLNFPVGTVVPVGSYDRDLGAWLPEDNGRVIKILSISGGLANLDTDGDGIVDNGASLGVTDAERLQLATLYSAGQTLWRTPIAHFTPWDCNFPFGPPPDSTPPNQPQPFSNTPQKDPCKKGGSIIECQNQILGETLRIVGTPYTLNYRSDRVVGRKAAYSLKIPLSGNTVPGGLRRIELEITIAGKSHKQTFNPTPNQAFDFTWDGLDSYGRPVQGSQPATVRMAYVYGLVYLEPAQFAQSWAAVSTSAIAITSRQSMETTVVQQFTATLGTIDARGQGLGAWTLSAHHSYDPTGGILYRGDGERINAGARNVIATIAGNGGSGFNGDGIPATQAQLSSVRGVALGPDGAIYIADFDNHRVRRVRHDGIIETVAGTEGFPPLGDGGPATQARLSFPSGLAFGPDGSLYIADFGNRRVRKVAPNGIINTIAGNGQPAFSGDNGPATDAAVQPVGVAIGAGGTVYIADGNGNNRVRQVSLNGIITTLAGTGSQTGVLGDGGPAISARVSSPEGVAVGPDGSVYIAEFTGQRVRRVSPNGIITTAAGGTLCSGNNPCGDGGPATNAGLRSPVNVSVAPDGTVYVTEFGRHVVRRVGPDGIISTFAGRGGFNGFSGDGGPATQATLDSPYGVGVDAGNRVFIADSANKRVRRVGPFLPGFSGNDIAVVSEDGTELYQFSPAGQHLKTFNTLTGAIRHSFNYDSAGRLTSLTDGDGNVTTIQRNANGNPTGILSPFGQQTLLTLDANGYLANVTNPAKETTSMIYAADGLLTTFTNPRGFSSHMTYDSLGRLTRDEDAAGGFWAITRAESNASFSTTLTSALGRATTYGVNNLSTGNQDRSVSFPAGFQNQSTIQSDGTTKTTRADNTVASIIEKPDPRWGMQAPIAGTKSIKTPAGLTLQHTSESSATLADPNNPLSLLTSIDSLNANGRIYTNVFDAGQRRHTLTTPSGRHTNQTIDSQERLLSLELPGLFSKSHAYDAQGRLQSITVGSGLDARITTLAYNAQGLLSSATDPLGRLTTFSYDSANRITQITRPDSQIVQLGYDANGNLTSITPPGKPAHTFAYSPVDLATAYTAPSLGSGTSDTTYQYNLDRQLTSFTRPDGRTVQFGYDNAGRIDTVTFSRGQTSFTYNPSDGKLATLTAPDGGMLTLTYDGPLKTGTSFSGNVTGSVTQTYDADFRISSQSVNGANTVTFQYDADSLVIQAGGLAITRNPQTALITGSTLDTVTDTFGYNSFGEIESYNASASGSALYNVQFVRNKVGQITQKIEMIEGSTDTYEYSYDLASRLTTVKKNGATTATYVYDANGNRLSVTKTGGTTNGIYDDQDTLTQYGSSTYSYTANGELLSKTKSGQLTNYVYDELGSLVHVDTPTGIQIDYVIDATNRRIGKKTNGVLTHAFLYQDGLRVVAELDGSNNVVSRFVYGSRINLPDYMVKGGVTYRFISDHLGSPRLIVNSQTGQIVQRLDYDEFGNVTLDSNPGFQPFGFAGGLYDKDTGLLRVGVRDYDAEIGRWTTKDPARFGDGTNLYNYVKNDPVNYLDLDGQIMANSNQVTKGVLEAIATVLGKTEGELIKYLNAKDLTPQQLLSQAARLLAQKSGKSFDEALRQILKAGGARYGAMIGLLMSLLAARDALAAEQNDPCSDADVDRRLEDIKKQIGEILGNLLGGALGNSIVPILGGIIGAELGGELGAYLGELL